MRILVHDFPGHAFPVGLSRRLARRGHTVLHAYSPDVTTGRGALDDSDDRAELEIRALALGRQFSRYTPYRRLTDELAYGRLLAHTLRDFRPTVVISANTPLLSQRLLQTACRKYRSRFIYWLQDLLGVGTASQLRSRFGALGRLPGSALRRLECNLLRRSEAIVAITEDFIPVLESIGVSDERVAVIHNWAPVDEIPVTSPNNDWANEHGLAEPFVFLYSGTMGLKHDPGLLVELAAKYRQDERVRVVVVSEGRGAAWLRGEATRLDLKNLLIFDYQPYEKLPDVLGSADVLISVLDSDAGVFSVPSKVLTYLCAGRPLLAAMPSDNLASRIVNRAEAGIVVLPADPDGFVDAAEALLANPRQRDEMGRSARSYAERAFDVDAVADRFESVLKRSVAD